MVGDARPELFICLVAPIGLNLKPVTDTFAEELRSVSYETKTVKLTDILAESGLGFDLSHKTEFERYNKYIAAGNKFSSAQRNIMATAGIARITAPDFQRGPSPQYKGAAFIFRQLKRPEEADLFRFVYGSNALILGCYAPRTSRIDNLVNIMQRNERGTNRNELEAKALQIIGIDENQSELASGQRFLETYAKSDFILDCTSPQSIRESVERFICCLFDHPFVSPSKDERGMFFAAGAALRSSDLSRQVGAAIFGRSHNIIALGCNEVPKAGGGTYWHGDDEDHRDFQLGIDSNHRIKEDMIRDALTRIQRVEGWLVPNRVQMNPEEISRAALARGDTEEGPLARAMITDVIEYGRMVHAEMNAITDAARFGRSVLGSTLYCTTMPCHMCTKLIISSGIMRVVYVEPYSKSLVREMFPDSVVIDGEPGKRVSFEPFRGVMPGSYIRFFKKGRRKAADGTANVWAPANAIPVGASDNPAAYRDVEAQMVTWLNSQIQAMKAR